MSLILEALKKSERQRRLGESPSLGSPVMAVRRRRSLMPALAVLIVIGVVALWWMQHASEEPPKPETASTPAPMPAPAQTPASARMPAPAAPQPSRVADATTFNDAPVMPSPAPSPASPREVREVREPTGMTRTNPEVEQRRKVRDGELVAADTQAGPGAAIKESEPVSAADPVALAAAMASAGKPVAGTLKAPNGKQPDHMGDRVEVKPALPTAPTVVTADGNALKLMWELPLATRSKLPEIKLSMHVFAADPSQRFAIINGERRAEGDDIEGMKLIEIRTDGVVFEFDDVRFMYPRGGR